MRSAPYDFAVGPTIYSPKQALENLPNCGMNCQLLVHLYHYLMLENELDPTWRSAELYSCRSDEGEDLPVLSVPDSSMAQDGDILFFGPRPAPLDRNTYSFEDAKWLHLAVVVGVSAAAITCLHTSFRNGLEVVVIQELLEKSGRVLYRKGAAKKAEDRYLVGIRRVSV